jgi:hypothetical protein
LLSNNRNQRTAGDRGKTAKIKQEVDAMNIKGWNEVMDMVEAESKRAGYWPAGITESEKLEYLKLETESRFNDVYGINQGYNESLKNMKHQIISRFQNVCTAHGLLLVKKGYHHGEFVRAGIVTSPGNSERIYFNGYNDRYYIFNGWESDEFGRVVDNPGFLEMVDVTDLLPKKPPLHQPLTAYEITYDNGEKTRTSMAAGVTLDDAKKYFIGKRFNFGAFPVEDMHVAVDVIRLD